ncbi:PREDICTED: carcinoembryonic antigen-related cell adhesion molecule 1 [Chrysochloris asiatica]|uniref:Carcinoembryonic antigen-related cell adhesion molecule 1 n=1 Tax=Chrysochloris asiatica TaxID=185453 RepID=A0A9B0U167_CHRAS|nr:PREDICTED: carcinoembryonic antigen-related cell adhesion molecule 1 [Chrysochloris asiatica]
MVEGKEEGVISLLTFWNPSLEAQLTVEPMPFDVAEGKDVLLLVYNLPENSYGYSWYKGDSARLSQQILAYLTENQSIALGVAHTGRETIYPNGTLLFQKVTQKDAGIYTLQVLNNDFQRELVSGRFRVCRTRDKPRIAVNSTMVTEHQGSVTFTCHGSYRGTSIQWSFNGQSLWLSERIKLSQDNRTLIINDVRKEDGGSYQCVVSNPAIVCRSDPATLNVSSREQVLGLSAGAIAGIVTGVLVGVAVAAALGYFLFFIRTWVCNQDDLGHQRPPGSTPSQGHSVSSTSPDPLYSNRAAVPIYERDLAWSKPDIPEKVLLEA